MSLDQATPPLQIPRSLHVQGPKIKRLRQASVRLLPESGGRVSLDAMIVIVIPSVHPFPVLAMAPITTCPSPFLVLGIHRVAASVKRVVKRDISRGEVALIKATLLLPILVTFMCYLRPTCAT